MTGVLIRRWPAEDRNTDGMPREDGGTDRSHAVKSLELSVDRRGKDKIDSFLEASKKAQRGYNSHFILQFSRTERE